MATPFVHNFTSATQILTPLAPNLNPSGFDTASMRVDCYGGTDINNAVNKLITTFKKGTPAPNGNQMYCTGVLSIEDARFGWVTGTIGYKGFWDATPDMVVSRTMEAYDRMWPFENNGVTNVFLGNTGGLGKTPYRPGGAPWRVRQYLVKESLTREGVSIGTAGDPPNFPPKPTIAAQRDFSLVKYNLQDPLLNTASGWVRLNYQITFAERVGNIVFRQWNDTWEYREKESE